MFDFIQGVEFSHFLLEKSIKKGSLVIDATAGNGKDTLFLAKLVGEKGKVLAFDIQAKAIAKTKELLDKNKLSYQVELYQSGHEKMALYLDKRKVDAILFNLGYLPGGDKNIITQAKTTLVAVKTGLEHLTKGGLIVLVVYPGHKGGQEELKALLSYVKELNQQEYNVLHYYFPNQKKSPPELIGIMKRN